MQFLQHRHDEQVKAKEHVGNELEKYHVQCVSVLICQIQLPESLMKTMTSKVVATQQMAMFDAQGEAEGRRKEMERIKAQADMQPTLVQAELGVKIADQKKQEQIILSEAKSKSIRLEKEGEAAGIEAIGKAKASKIEAVGRATATSYRQQVDALGSNSLAMIEVMKQIAESNVKITPDVLVNSGYSDKGGHAVMDILSGLLAKNLGQQPVDMT